MKEYMLVYINDGTDACMHDKTDTEMKAVMDRWASWMAKLQEQDRLVSGGSPLIPGGQRMDASRVVTDIAAAEFKELVSGYSIIRAESPEEAAVLTKDCPIFDSPGCITEIREVMQLG